MKKILLATAALVALGSASAVAADLPARTYTKAPAYVAPVYNWTGFYVGAHIGAGFNSNDSLSQVGFAPALVRSGDNASFLGGGQVGADYQFSPNWLVGIEGQISGLANNNRTFSDGVAGGVTFTDKNDWLASVTGRLGYVWGPGMIYAKGGVAFRDNNNFAASAAALPAVVGQNDTGYTVGGGLEYMFAPAWSAKVEYQYYNFNTTTVTSTAIPASFSYRDDLHTVKLGVNYHFNWGGPVVARY
ncbi:MAG: porin family protein [Afipia sp.]|nr:porin family protein [Afipia sp.]